MKTNNKKKQYLKDLNGKDLVGKRILIESYHSYDKSYSVEEYKVVESDSTGTRIKIKPAAGTQYINWVMLSDKDILEILPDNPAIDKIHKDVEEATRERSRYNGLFGF